MYLIIGLGNPEPEYSKTRHNMGFDVINKLAKKYNIPLSKNKFEGVYGSGIIENEKVILLKPQTYMNLSGNSIKQYINFFKIDFKKIIVIYDDMDTEKGEIRIRAKGGSGGHNGMKSIINELLTEEFARIRIGIGKPVNEFDRIDYVIGKVSEEEYEKLEKGISKAAKAVVEFIKSGIDSSMNKFN